MSSSWIPHLVGRRFQPEALAGTGGMGVVYRACDTQTGQTIALKLLEETRAEPQNVERFTREATLLSELRHPGIVTYIDHGITDDGRPYLAMEWLEGEDLHNRLARGPMRLSEALLLVRRVAEALAVAHRRGIVHRDLKPSNLFLREGEVEKVTLLDFGIARRHAATRPLTGTGTILGTPAYMAPEQVRGERELTPAADVFSLGCVLYECLAGQPAFSAEHVLAVFGKILFAEPPRLRAVRPDLPEEVERLLGRMLARELSDRLPDAAAVAAVLTTSNLVVEQVTTVSLEAVAPRSRLPDEERFLISVLIATPSIATDGMRGAEGADAPGDRLDELKPLLGALGARVEVMADGSLAAALVHARDAATDHAALAARCALLLSVRLPSAAIALCTGRGHLRGALPVGEVLDRTAGLLRERRDTPSSGQILIDDLTRGLLDTRFHVHRTLSGAFVLTGEELALDASRPLLCKPTPCVGRESELGMLEIALASAIENATPQAVLVTAPPGTGKSRLRHEFLRRLESRGDAPLVLIGLGDPMSAGSAYGMLGGALRRLCGILDGEGPSVQREKLARRAALHLSAADGERVVAFLGEVCGVPFQDDENVKLRAARLDPQVMSDQISGAMLDFLRAECAARPLLLVLEDLHWGDAPTVKVVGAALREISDRPFMVLALARPEVEEIFPRLWGESAQRTPLRPLSKKAGERLVREVLGAVVPPEAVTRLVEQSEGNALFLEELIRGIAEGHGDEVPATVLAMLQARIGRLPPGARRVLRAASVFGEVCWLGGLRALLRGTASQEMGLEGALRMLLEREILEERRESRFQGEQEYRFRHALMRDAAYSLLSEEERVDWHRRTGEYLEERGESNAMILAEHFVQGRQRARAIPYFIQAADQLYETNDLNGVLACAGRGLDCGAEGEPRGALLSLQVAAYVWREQYADALSAGMAALEQISPSSRRWYRAAQYILPAAALTGQQALVASLGARLESVEPDADATSEFIRAVLWLSVFLGVAGMKDAAATYLQRAQSVIARTGSSDKITLGHLKSATANYKHVIAEDPWACMLDNRESFLAFRESGYLQHQCVSTSYYGKALLDLGDWASAEASLRENLMLAERLNESLLLTLARSYLARLLAASTSPERVDEASRLAREVIAANTPTLVGLAHGVMAEIMLRKGDLLGADKQARAASEAIRPFPTFSWDIIALHVRILLAQGRAAEALQMAEDALGELERLELFGFGEIHLRLAVAEALHAVGQTEAARRALQKLLERLRARVDGIPEMAARERYLDQVPTHARALKLAREWLGEEAASARFG